MLVRSATATASVGSALFATGVDSPVKVDSSISSPEQEMIRQSAGTASPVSNDTTSPATSSSAEVSRDPSVRCTRTRTALTVSSRRSVRRAVTSCAADNKALARMTMSTRIASIVDPDAAEIAAPTARGAVSGVLSSATAAASRPALTGSAAVWKCAPLPCLLDGQALGRGVKESQHLVDRKRMPRHQILRHGQRPLIQFRGRTRRPGPDWPPPPSRSAANARCPVRGRASTRPNSAPATDPISAIRELRRLTPRARVAASRTSHADSRPGPQIRCAPQGGRRSAEVHIPMPQSAAAKATSLRVAIRATPPILAL